VPDQVGGTGPPGRRARAKELLMTNAGLWIDHAKALIVIIFDGGERKLEILSHADMALARAGKA
jgi:hypothetical protein